MEELYNSLFEAGDYTGSFQEFKDQFGDSTKSQTLYNALNEAGDYTGSLEDFNIQFEFSPAEDFQTDDAPSAVAESQEGEIALTDQEIKDTDSQLVDTSLESQKKNVIDADANIESIYDNYQKYADENMPVSYNFDNPVGQFIVDKLAAFTSGATELLAGVGDFAEMLIEAPVQSAISAYNYFADDENDITQEQRNVVSGLIEQTFFADDALRIVSDASSRLKTKRDDEDGVGILGAIKEKNYLEALDRTLSGIFEAAPSVVAAVGGGLVGLGVIGASSTGQHYEEKSEKNPEERGLAMLGVSAVQGGIELASELVTRGIFKGVGSMVGAQGKALAKNVLGRVSTGMFFEGTSEVASQEANNVIDQMWGLNKYYDKDGNFDGKAALTRVFDTFLISAALGGGTTVAGELSGRQKALEADRMMSPLQQKQNIKLAEEIAELQKLNTGVDNSQINEKIALKKAELLKNNARNRQIVDGFSNEEKVEYLKILQDQTELQSEAKNLDLTEDQSNLNKQTQEQNISKLNSMYKNKADALAQDRKARTLQFAEDAASLGIKSTALSPEDFNKKAREIEISNIDETLDESKVAAKKDKINKTDYSKDSGGFFVNGEFFMNKDKLIELNQLNVGAHETLHPILNALVGDAEKQGIVVEKFKKQLSKEQLDFMEGMMKARRYTENKNTYNKEYLTVFSDAIADKEIKYNETLFTKIGDMLMPLFRSLGFSKLKFDTGKDVYNFMREYSKSAEKGAISKDIKQFVAPKLGVITDFSKTKKQESRVVQDLQQELDNLDEFDFDNEFEYDQAVANLESKIRSAKVKAKKKLVEKEEQTKEKTPQKTYDNEKLVETIKSEKTTRKEKAVAEADLVDSFDTMALKAIKYDTRKGDYDRTEVRDYLRQFLPGILSKYRPSVEVTQKMLDGKAETVSEKQDLKIFNSYKKNNPSKQFNVGDNIEVKFSTWVYNNIAPKAQQTYEKFRKIADKSLDAEAGTTGSVKETAADTTTITEDTSKTKPKGGTIKPVDLLKDPEVIKQYKQAVAKAFKELNLSTEDLTFGKLTDLAPEVIAKYLKLPLNKVTNPADNLAFKDFIVTEKLMTGTDKKSVTFRENYPDAKEGDLIKNEARKIQDFVKTNLNELLRLMPAENVAPELATVDAEGYKTVKGTGLKIKPSLLKYFYEKTGKRSKGLTSQAEIAKLKKLTKEDFLEGFGITKDASGQFKYVSSYDRVIGQRLKAIVDLVGKLATNTEIRQLEGITETQAQNIAAGKSDVQFSLTKEGLNLLEKQGINDKYNGFRSDFTTSKRGTKKHVEIDNYISDIIKLTKVFNTDDFKIFNSTVLQFTEKAINSKQKRDYLRDELAKLRKNKTLEARLEVGRTPFAKFLGNNVATIEEKTLSNPDRLKDYNEKHRKVFLKMWNKINTILSNPSTRDLALPITYFLENAINERSNPMSMGALAIASPFEGGRVIWDHAFPQTQASRFLLDSILDENKSFKKALERVEKNYYAIALTKSDQKKVDDAKSSKDLNENEQWYERLANAGVDLSKYAYFGPDGKGDTNLASHLGLSFSKTFKNENTLDDLGLQPYSNHESLLDIQFSKNKRKEYEDVLRNKRPELIDIPKQVDELFKWADKLKVKDNKKSKYKKLALYYTANGFTMFPEDGYKIEEVIRLAEVNKVDPYAYKNPDELINKFTKEDKTKTINPDNVKEFSGKRVLPKGVTIYDVDDSKAGQLAVRSIVDSNWGKEANPWCLIARQPKGEDYIANQQAYSIDELNDIIAAESALGNRVEIEDNYTEANGTEVWELVVYGPSDGDGMSNAWEMWKTYNKSGYGYKIAFQNGKLISFRDGGSVIVDEYDAEEPDLTWWDRFDKPTDTLQINLGKKNGLTTRGEIYFDEFTKKAEVELVGYGEGDFMSRKNTYKLYDSSKEVLEAKVYKDGKISSSIETIRTRMNDGGRATETKTTNYDNGSITSSERIIKDLRTGEIVTKSTTLNERLSENSYIESSIIIGKNGKTPSAPKVTEKNIILIEEVKTGFNQSTEYYAERITDGVSDVVIDRMSELNKIKESSIQFSKSVEKATKSNNNMLPDSKKLKGDFTMDQVLNKMRELDNQQTESELQFSNILNLDKDFNDIIENKTGIASGKEFKRVKAEVVGASKGRFKFLIPPSAEDFVGLLYATLGKGSKGDAQMAWYKKVLLNPFAKAMENISRDRNALGRDFRALKKTLKIVPKNLKKKVPGEPFTVEQAVRVWIWNQIGKDVPGLDDADIKALVDYVNARPDLKTFGTEIMKLNKGTSYISPSDSWNTGTITTDLLETLNTTKRKQYLEVWQQNVDIIFSEKNLNKLEAAYGKQYRKAMENILTRMKTGRNRVTGTDSLTTRVTDWLTGSIGAIMFFNTRSAVLQTLSAVNFINFGDNNILAAGKAFANQKQYWTDFKKIFNSEFLIERRDGLKMNVNEADIADIAKERGVRGVINKLLKVGFTPTQIADSFAIASGGATFYRNRLNALIKGGMNTQAAEKQALSDFREIAEESQQSSRPDKISQQQAGPLGRVILAFANTPAQYARLMKKAASDLKNRRGDDKTNISKIIYYGVAQNLIFNALQQALFAITFGEDEEEDEKKIVDVTNGMVDSLLRGTGIGGAVISTVKNALLKLAKENAKKNPKYESVATELLKISPPISSKISKIRAAGRSYSWDKKEMKEKGFSLDNPAYLAGANVISATTNVPLDRVVKKVNNVMAAGNDDISYIEKIALLSGWSEWQLGIKESKKDDKKGSKRKTYTKKVYTRKK